MKKCVLVTSLIVACANIFAANNNVKFDIDQMQQICLDANTETYVRPVFKEKDMPVVIKMIEENESVKGFQGFGVALTGATCYMLSQMEEAERKAFLNYAFGKDGLNLSVARLTIGTCDYSAELYSYDEVPFDTELKHFTIKRDEKYVIPMIKEILKVRPDLMIFASPWSPPAWMKTSEKLCGGYMREQYIDCYADYIVKYMKAYEKHGIHITALTPQNEPETHQESRTPTCIWHPEMEAKFVKILRKKLTDAGFNPAIWIYDHNFSGFERVRWTLNLDKSVRESVQGMAFHYYDGFIEQTYALKKEFPELELHFTEGGPRLKDNYATDWCKWGFMISRAVACGYKSFTGFNLVLDEKGGPNVAPFYCGGLFSRDSKTHALVKSGQCKAFQMIAPYISPKDELQGLRQEFCNATLMFCYPSTMREDVDGFKIKKENGYEYVVLVNPNTEKSQVSFSANGSRWYVELQPNSISLIK